MKSGRGDNIQALALISFILIVVMVFPAWGKNQDKTDIYQVSLEDLKGRDLTDLDAEAWKAYQAKEYEKAAQAYIEILRQRPGQARIFYNLACLYSLLGAEERSAEFLEASWEAGNQDMNQIQRDPDFDRVRSSKAFTKTMEALRKDSIKREKRRGQLLGVKAPRLAIVRVLEPSSLKPDRKYPLVVGLHGAGGDEENFLALFKDSGISPRFFYCTIQGPVARPVGNRIGYVWYQNSGDDPTKPETLSVATTEETILTVIDEVSRAYPVDPDRIYLMGFSQGGIMTYRVGLKYPERFAGLIPVGGIFNRDGITDEELKKAKEKANFLICTSPEDDPRIVDSQAEAARLFKEIGLQHEAVSYAGGHVVSDEVLKKVNAWIEAGS